MSNQPANYGDLQRLADAVGGQFRGLNQSLTNMNAGLRSLNRSAGTTVRAFGGLNLSLITLSSGVSYFQRNMLRTAVEAGRGSEALLKFDDALYNLNVRLGESIIHDLGFVFEALSKAMTGMSDTTITWIGRIVLAATAVTLFGAALNILAGALRTVIVITGIATLWERRLAIARGIGVLVSALTSRIYLLGVAAGFAAPFLLRFGALVAGMFARIPFAIIGARIATLVASMFTRIPWGVIAARLLPLIGSALASAGAGLGILAAKLVAGLALLIPGAIIAAKVILIALLVAALVGIFTFAFYKLAEALGFSWFTDFVDGIIDNVQSKVYDITGNKFDILGRDNQLIQEDTVYNAVKRANTEVTVELNAID